MSATKWTPGPWIVDNDDPKNIAIRPANQGFLLAAIGDFMETHKGARKANARLIAAAPELAEALESFANSAEAYMKYHGEKFYPDIEPKPTGLWPQIHKARAALAKAKGE